MGHLKYLNMESFMYLLLLSHQDKKIELTWDFQLDIHIELNFGLMELLMWIIQLGPLNYLKMAKLMIQLINFHWYNNM